jgi:hypothetical protein
MTDPPSPPSDAVGPGDPGQLESLYRSVLKPRIDALEGERLRIRRGLIGSLAIVGGTLLLVIAVVMLEIPGAAWLVLGILAAGVVVAGRRSWTLGLATIGHRARFKREVLAEVFGFVCPGASYAPDRRIATEILVESRIFRIFDQRVLDLVRGDDLVRGRIGETPFEVSELSVVMAGGKSGPGAFVGPFFHFDFNKTLRGVTIVQPEGSEVWAGGAQDGRQLVAMENTVFESRFAVYATDPVEARYILTPALMERIVRIRAETGRPIYLAFSGGRAFVAIHYGRELFEPDIHSTTSLAAIAEMAKHFALAEFLVRELDLNTRIWTKETDASLLAAPSAAGPLEAFSPAAPIEPGEAGGKASPQPSP